VVNNPLLMSLVSGACLLLLFANLGGSLSSKSIALLGVLVAINATLRLIDNTFLPQGEFSPIFVLITLVGYCFGAQLGFQMGALTLLVSAIITGGIGPWLPYQMFGAGWVGLTAAWLPRFQRPTYAVIMLAAFGFVWGLLYGGLLNLSSASFLLGAGSAPLPVTLPERLSQYAAYYVVQSLPFDVVRAVGNAAMMLVLGTPLLKVFTRFRHRFEYQVVEQIG
jgi:energy-coupling factor transport system substrate-specific component